LNPYSRRAGSAPPPSTRAPLMMISGGRPAGVPRARRRASHRLRLNPQRWRRRRKLPPRLAEDDRKRLAMNADLLLVLGALIACVGLFIINKPRMDVVALLLIVILPLAGIISMPEALAGRRFCKAWCTLHDHGAIDNDRDGPLAVSAALISDSKRQLGGPHRNKLSSHPIRRLAAHFYRSVGPEKAVEAAIARSAAR